MISEQSHLRRFPFTAHVAAFTLLFLYVPMIALVTMSFNRGNSALVWTGWGLHGYVDAWEDPTLVRAAWSSLKLGWLSAIFSTAIAIASAVVMWGRDGKRKQVIEDLITVPLVVPEIVMAIATLLVFSALSIELSFFTVWFAHVVFCLPFAYLPIRAGLRNIDRNLLDAAADLSATPWGVFRQITLPLALPGIAVGGMLAFLVSMDDFVTTFFVAGPGVTTLPMYIFGALKQGLTPKINAISTVILLLSVLVSTVSMLFVPRNRKHSVTSPEDEEFTAGLPSTLTF